MNASTDPGFVALVIAALAIAVMAAWSLYGRARGSRSVRARHTDERLLMALRASGEYYWEYHIRNNKLHLLTARAGATPTSCRMIERILQPEHIIHATDLADARTPIRSCVYGRRSKFIVELRIMARRGTPRWFRVRGRVLEVDRKGIAVRLAGTALDIDARRQNNRITQVAAEVLRSMNEAVAVMDRNFNYVSVNPAFERITGFREQEILGHNVGMMHSPQQGEEIYRDYQSRLAENGAWSGELWQRQKDGEDFLCKIEAHRVETGRSLDTLYAVVISDITQQKKIEEELRYLANFDSLTNLPNRSLMSERLSRAIVRARRERTQVAVLYLDLDRFKDINDSLGHSTGDRILRAVATRLQQTVGEKRTVSRLSGDEFTIILDSLADATEADRVAREIIMAFEAPLLLGHGQEVVISPSVGVSLYPDHGVLPTELLKCADIAMYKAKGAGRRTFIRYDHSMDIAQHQRATLSSALRTVLERGELHLMYQPRLDLSSNRVSGAEALLRWSSGEHGDVLPDEFIPLAEKNGMILEIGEWVLREACLTLQRWQSLGLDDIAVSLNVSTIQLLRSDLIDVVRRVLTDTGIQPHLLELELTESMLMANAEEASRHLHDFRRLGVSLAIDDFGTGYSSLSYLKRLPINSLKIDKSFIREVDRDREDAAITRAVIAMAHAMGIRVVAEGVETQAQFEFLRKNDCDEIQGYWLAQAMTPGDCLDFIRNWDDTSMPRQLAIALEP